MFQQRKLGKALPSGVVPFPLGRWPWKAHDVTQEIHDVIQHLWRFWEVVVARVACSRGPRKPNVFLQEAIIALEGANITLEGHGVFIFS
jgi:hypothetical protein